MSNPLQMSDQNPDPNAEPDMQDWVQPYGIKPEPPTSAPKNPPQPKDDQLTDPDQWAKDLNAERAEARQAEQNKTDEENKDEGNKKS